MTFDPDFFLFAAQIQASAHLQRGRVRQFLPQIGGFQQQRKRRRPAVRPISGQICERRQGPSAERFVGCPEKTASRFDVFVRQVRGWRPFFFDCCVPLASQLTDDRPVTMWSGCCCSFAKEFSGDTCDGVSLLMDVLRAVQMAQAELSGKSDV